MALGSTYSQQADGGLVWWANFNAAYKANGGAAKVRRQAPTTRQSASQPASRQGR